MSALLDEMVKNGETVTRFVHTRDISPWHGLGTDVEQGEKVSQMAERIGALDNYEGRKLYYPSGDGAIEVLSDGRIAFQPGKVPQQAILDSRGRYMSTMGADYQIHQPAEVIKTLEAYEETGLMQAKTLGFLDQGRRMFVLFAPTDLYRAAIKDEQIETYVMGLTSFDGSTKTMWGNTCVCIVCRNTQEMALAETGKKRVTASHRVKLTQNVQAEVRRLLDDNRASLTRFIEIGESLAETPMSDPETLATVQYLSNRKWFEEREKANGSKILHDLLASEDSREIAELLLQSANGSNGSNVYRLDGDMVELNDLSRVGHSILDEILNGPGASLEARQGTAWGVYNGVTGHVDHKAGRDRDTALVSAWSGTGARLKAQALEVLTAVATAKRGTV